MQSEQSTKVVLLLSRAIFCYCHFPLAITNYGQKEDNR